MKNSVQNVGPPWLEQRIHRGEIVIIDGGTGTELERRGVPMSDDAWCGVVMRNHADVLRSVHEDYIRAGADVIITNTYASARHVLEPAGLGDDVEELNRIAVSAALQARDASADRDVVIAGSLGDFRGVDVQRWIDSGSVAATYREQAEILADAGVDLLMMEMMREPDVAVPAIEAALDTGLPVWVGCSCDDELGGSRLKMRNHPERDFGECLDAVVDLGGAVVSMMHVNVPFISPAIDEVKARWSGPLGAYPNSGHFAMPSWQFVDIISPEDLVAEARGWIEKGVQIIGGCCGIGPEHIARLKAELPSKLGD